MIVGDIGGVMGLMLGINIFDVLVLGGVFISPFLNNQENVVRKSVNFGWLAFRKHFQRPRKHPLPESSPDEISDDEQHAPQRNFQSGQKIFEITL